MLPVSRVSLHQSMLRKENRLHGSDAIDDINDESCADINWQ